METPPWVYALSAGTGVLGVFVPAFAPELVREWHGTRLGFVAAAGAAVVLHAALHAVFPRAKLAPGALVGAAALAVFALASPALGWCAFVANASASGPDVYEGLAGR